MQKATVDSLTPSVISSVMKSITGGVSWTPLDRNHEYVGIRLGEMEMVIVYTSLGRELTIHMTSKKDFLNTFNLYDMVIAGYKIVRFYREGSTLPRDAFVVSTLIENLGLDISSEVNRVNAELPKKEI